MPLVLCPPPLPPLTLQAINKQDMSHTPSLYATKHLLAHLTRACKVNSSHSSKVGRGGAGRGAGWRARNTH